MSTLRAKTPDTVERRLVGRRLVERRLRGVLGGLAAFVVLAIASAQGVAAPQPTVGQAKPAIKPPKPENQFLLRPILGLSTAGLRLTPTRPKTPGGDKNKLDWTPNSAMKVGARAGYGPFLATATVDLAPSNPVDTHGKSRGLELGFTSTLRLDGHEIATTFFFQRYSGFYLSTTKDLFPKAESPLLAPRLTLTTYGVSMLFFNDPNFSYDDAFVEYRPKEEGENSLGLRLALGRFTFDAGPNSLIPGKFEADFADAFGLNALAATYASLGIGFAADWRPWGRVLLGLSIFAGATFSTTSFRISGYERRAPIVGPSASSQAVAGWAGNVIHWGLMASTDLEGMRIEGTDLQATRTNVLFFLGLTL